MYKLSTYYHAHAKQELPYYSIEKTSDQICEILVNAHLYPDEDLIDTMEENIDDTSSDTEMDSYGEEDDLLISRVLNLNANVFIKDSSLEEQNNIQNAVEIENEVNIEWDPIAKADNIVNSI